MNHLHYLRLRRRLSQKALADLLKIHPTTLCRIEGGWLSRCPAGVEERLKAVFGAQWSFDALMESVPNLAEARPDTDTTGSEQ